MYDFEEWNGGYYLRGNCTAPNHCTCLCKEAYDPHDCINKDINCEGAWQDPMVKSRNVLPLGNMFGSRRCLDGYEGSLNGMDRYISCHLTIYVPTSLEANSITIITSISVTTFVLVFGYYYLQKKLKEKFLMAKIERRRSRRSSEESMTENT